MALWCRRTFLPYDMTGSRWRARGRRHAPGQGEYPPCPIGQVVDFKSEG